MILKIKKVDPEAIIPQYANFGDAGLDLAPCKDYLIEPHGSCKMDTGLRIAIPQGYVGLIFERSSTYYKTGLSLTNKVGVIDSGYRDNWLLSVKNTTDKVVDIQKGDRIAQLVIVPFVSAVIEEVDELDETERGLGGWGSSGR